jgi:hypothetical protein
MGSYLLPNLRLAMYPIKLLASTSTVVACAIALASCAAKPPPAPEPAPVAWVQPANPPQPDEWNIFPDPTTGQVDVYHKGEYAGSVTGNEPKDEDLPIPHPVTPAN